MSATFAVIGADGGIVQKNEIVPIRRKLEPGEYISYKHFVGPVAANVGTIIQNDRHGTRGSAYLSMMSEGPYYYIEVSGRSITAILRSVRELETVLGAVNLRNREQTAEVEDCSTET